MNWSAVPFKDPNNKCSTWCRTLPSWILTSPHRRPSGEGCLTALCHCSVPVAAATRGKAVQMSAAHLVLARDVRSAGEQFSAKSTLLQVWSTVHQRWPRYKYMYQVYTYSFRVWGMLWIYTCHLVWSCLSLHFVFSPQHFFILKHNYNIWSY